MIKFFLGIGFVQLSWASALDDPVAHPAIPLLDENGQPVQKYDEPVAHPAIPLLDENGQHVLKSNKPYAPRMTCGTAGCHDYDAMMHSFHFEAGRDEARDDFGEMRHLPQLVSPGYFGGYNCMGGSNPDILAKKNNANVSDFADHGAAGWVQRCISCHAGGGWMEKDRLGRRYDTVDPATVTTLDGDYYNRGTDENNQPADSAVVSQWNWQKSGVVENDCFLCHYRFDDLMVFDPQLPADTSGYDHFRDMRNTHLADQGFFRYVDTAILEVMNLKHADGVQTDKSLVTFNRQDGKLNIGADGQPLLSWNAQAFDAEGKVVIPMLRYPNNDNCMMCHRTSNSRRGFYGFGEKTAMEFDEEGILQEDYQDDVHYGKTWTEANGEARAIENCNACHSESYYRPAFSNVNLDNRHQFLKGNSDMDVRNDLDYHPAPKSCEYCHKNAPNAAIPSGHANLLEAHLERWKASGDMQGYSANSLTRITQTHFDVISCQACHITGKKSRGQPLQIMYRYRKGEEGAAKIIPYNPRLRYYWKDKTTGYVLNQTERNSVFSLKTDAEGQKYGELINPSTSEVLGTVSARMSHGSWRFNEPENYEGYVALKMAYDSVLANKGIANPNAVMVWTESNYYVMSHNTRLAVDSVQCEECHNRKQDGAFSALISPQGILSVANVKTVTQLPDRRLVDEGIVILDKPYMQISETGVVTENIADILYESKINPSMSILSAANAKVMMAGVQRYPTEDGIRRAEIGSYPLQNHFFTPEVYLFKPNYGEPSLRDLALLLEASSPNEAIFSKAKLQVALVADSNIVTHAEQAGYGGLTAAVFNLEAYYDNGQPLTQVNGGSRVLVKLPYQGSKTDPAEVRVIYSSNGNEWTTVDSDDVIFIQPQTEENKGYVLFWTNHFSYYTVTDSSTSSSTPGETSSDSGGGGGGSVFYLPIILLLFLGLRWLNVRKAL